MIRHCACTKGSATFPENPKQRESSKSCKSCGGKVLVDGRGAQSGSMLSTVGLEFPSVIDPHLNWKKASNGRQRAVRRARTSFTGGNRMKSTAKSSKDSEDLTDKDSKKAADMPVSESEKLGVSILGRRFGDTLESVPIKKRRFLLVRSPSPPRHLSSHSDGSDHILESQPVSYQGTALNAKQHLHDEVCDDKTDLEGVNGKSFDTTDFSGISILAAAACDSNIRGDFMNSEFSVSTRHSSEEGFLGKNFMSAEKEELPPQTSEDLDGKVDLPGKELNGIKADRSDNLEKSMNSTQIFPNKTRTESSSRDDRFHWDLNTVMDVWETNCDEGLNSELLAANIVGEDGVHDEKLGNVNLCQGQVGFGATKNASELVDNRVHLGGAGEDIVSLEEIKMQEKSDAFVGKHYFSLPCGDAPAEEECQFEDVAVADVSEEIKHFHNQEKSCFITEGVSSPLGVALIPVRDASLATASALDEEKAGTHCISFHTDVETKTSSSHLDSCENVSIGHTAHACEPHQGMDQRIMEAVNGENSYAASLAETDNCSADCSTNVVEMGQVTHLRSCQAEKHESLCIDSGTGMTDQHLSHLAKNASDVLVDVVTTGVISGETASIGTLDKTDCSNADKSKEGDLTPCPINSLSSQGLCNNDELTSGSACVGGYEAIASEMKVTENKYCVLTDVSLNNAKTDPPVHIGSEPSLCNSTSMTLGLADAPFPDGALSSQVTSKSHPDGYASSPGRVALEDHLDCDYFSDVSQNDTDQAIGMEKVEFLGDDDDQYEDGELRESFVSSWGEDGAEERETECVDYGSDRETDMFEAASDFPASVNLHVDNIEYKNGGRDVQDAVTLPSLKCPLVTDVSDAGSGKRIVGSVAEKVSRGHLRIKEGSKQLLRDVKDASEFGAGNEKVIGDSEFLNAGDSARESSHSASFRLKLSGWDQLPEGCRSYGDGVINSRVDSANKNHYDATLDPSGAGESVSRVVGSSLRRDLSSRIERSKSSDMSHRKDNSYVRACRSNDRNDFNSKVERGSDASRSVGRNGLSLHLQGRGRDAHWTNSPNHNGNSRLDSSGYYGSTSFTHPGSRNAAAAAVAKVENNGFVVASDGTIVKAGGVGPASRLARRSAKVSPQSTHRSLVGNGSPIERDGAFGMPPGLGHPRERSPNSHMSIGRGRAGRYGPGMVSIGHREKYRRPMPNDSKDSSSAMPHPVSRREQSFSPPPHRRPLHPSRSHNRSPSRSRTRSPHRWASPRGRSYNGMNGGPGIRRRSRSPPNFKSEARIERIRHGFGEHMVTYAPSSRNQTSPPHASRWIDGRKDLSDQYREHEYKRCSGRIPPARVFSRGKRFDPIESRGRLKSDDYYRPMHSGNFPEFVGFGRGSRHDGSGDDRRGHGDRYEMFHSLRQYDIDGNMKRFRDDVEGGFRAHNTRPKYFQRRESPQAFDRGIERQLGDSPRRDKEEKSHFRHGKDGKPSANASFKSFGVRDCDDDLDARRRRPS